MTDDISWYLLNWARYMRAGCSPAKLPNQSPAMTGLPNYIFDDEAQYEQADLTAARATDAAIADLEPIESCAIHHAYLHAVFRFHRRSLDDVLELAKKHVQESLIRRGIFVARDVDKGEKQA